MGNWSIEIKGTGAHHNKDFPQDANLMTLKFVADLRAAGHQVAAAFFETVAGQRDDYTDA